MLALPSNRLAYVALLAALLSAIIHLLIAPRVMEFNQLVGILFYLNGAGWIGGIFLYLSRFWRRELYLVAAGYAVVTIAAFFVMGGQINAISVASKVAEGVVALVALYLYAAE
jgi:hypothetical protein